MTTWARLGLWTGVGITTASVVLGMSPSPVHREHRPVIVGSRFIDPMTGRTVGFAPELEEVWGETVPGPLGQFRFHDDRGRVLIADTFSKSVIRSTEPRVDFEGKRLRLMSPSDELAWEKDLPSPVSRSDSYSVIAPDRVIVSHETGVAAFSLSDGSLLWDQSGESESLYLWKDWVLCFDALFLRPDYRQHLIARRLTDGGEAWRREMMVKERPAPPIDLGSHVLIRSKPFFERQRYAAILDESGRDTLRFSENVHAAFPMKDGWTIVTDERVARVGMSGELRWEYRTTLASGGMLQDDKVLTFGWHGPSDSGVTAQCFDVEFGNRLWSRECPPLGIEHLKYSHRVYWEVRGDRIVVVDQGGGGWFVELLDIETGRQVSRCVEISPNFAVNPSRLTR